MYKNPALFVPKKEDKINIQGLDNLTRHESKIQSIGRCGDDSLAVKQRRLLDKAQNRFFSFFIFEQKKSSLKSCKSCMEKSVHSQGQEFKY